MSVSKVVIGKRFGRLTVISRTDIKDSGRHYKWLCKCDCGNEKIVSSCNLTSGNTLSCGCLKREVVKHNAQIKHGKSNTRLYGIWRDMKSRCHNPKSPKHKVYFDRNITVCDEWANDFEIFYYWAINNGYSEELTIDRIDNEKGYQPDNCRWTTQLEQQRNKRNNHNIHYNGETHCLTEWCELLGLNYRKTKSRINNLKWDIERAFTTP